jgi:hypothetical protein
MLHNKNQLPRLPQSDIKCNETRVVVMVVFLTIMIRPQQKLFLVVLSCWLGCGNLNKLGQNEND